MADDKLEINMEQIHQIIGKLALENYIIKDMYEKLSQRMGEIVKNKDAKPPSIN